MADQLLDLALMLRPDADATEREHMARLAGRLGYVAVHVPVSSGGALGTDELDALVAAADPAMLVVDDGADAVGIVRRNDPDQVLALARAGAEVLLVTVPHERDVADLLAQIKALVVGATPALFDR